MKPLLIGQAPSRTGDPKKPLESAKISDLFGLSHALYLSVTERTNLLYSWPGAAGKRETCFQ